jgi:hypothetical protein
MKHALWVAIVVVLAGMTWAEDDLPVMRSNQERVSIRDGRDFRDHTWILTPEAKPDVYSVDLLHGEPHTVTFISDVDSISFQVEEGGTYDFIVRWGDKVCYTQLVGRRFIPAAVFDADTQRQRRGKTFIEVPEVYELVNVAIAMTSLGDDRNFVYQASPYHERVRAHFGAYRNHPFVAGLDSLFRRDTGHYATIKMNGNAFEFDAQGKIVPSSVYDRTGFRNERTNSLRPYLQRMQAFADASGFRRFYEENMQLYQQQIAFFRDSVGVAEMKRWLDRNFPGSDDYDTYRIIFSPLVSYNQSTTWFESNGFKELQPHINFPYRADANPSGTLSHEAETIFRGNILFTELNHGYINPRGDQFRREVAEAISHRDTWVDKTRDPRYYRGNATFHEYMNWGLVCLRILDTVPKGEQAELIDRVERMMVDSRGFRQFRPYNAFLMDLYANRDPQTTLSDLYPQIIAWFASNN